jgi:hypothetical protein
VSDARAVCAAVWLRACGSLDARVTRLHGAHSVCMCVRVATRVCCRPVAGHAMQSEVPGCAAGRGQGGALPAKGACERVVVWVCGATDVPAALGSSVHDPCPCLCLCLCLCLAPPPPAAHTCHAAALAAAAHHRWRWCPRATTSTSCTSSWSATHSASEVRWRTQAAATGLRPQQCTGFPCRPHAPAATRARAPPCRRAKAAVSRPRAATRAACCTRTAAACTAAACCCWARGTAWARWPSSQRHPAWT